MTGKYGRDKIAEANQGASLPDKPTAPGAEDAESDGRLNGDNPFGGMLFTERNFDVVDVLREVTGEVGRSMAEVALSWVATRPGVSSVLIGASGPSRCRRTSLHWTSHSPESSGIVSIR